MADPVLIRIRLNIVRHHQGDPAMNDDRSSSVHGRSVSLYKYFPPERVDFFASHLVRFTPPSAFNDPFDTKPVISAGGDPTQLDLATPHAPMVSQLRQSLQKVYDVMMNRPRMGQNFIGLTYGILSMSERNDSLLMWAHYAEDHRGFVVQFRSSHRWFVGVRKIVYSDERPFVAPFSKSPSQSSFENSDDNFYIKGRDWAYEKEWRLVRKVGAWELTSKDEKSQLHLLSVPVSAITAVFIGARMPSDRRTQLDSLLLEKQNSRLVIVQSKLSIRRFELEFVPVARKTLKAALNARTTPTAIR